MGTTYNVKFWSPGEIDQASLQTKIDLELARINKLMSTYDPTSELSKFNQSTSVDVYPLSPDTLKVIKEGMRIGRLSDGYLDITVGPLVNLWGFGPQAKPEVVPSKQDIAIARRKTGLEKLVLHDDGAQKSHTGLYVDLSTIAKGFGVDQVAALKTIW
jgi:thiamine biosynthesis lipoprotein